MEKRFLQEENTKHYKLHHKQLLQVRSYNLQNTQIQKQCLRTVFTTLHFLHYL